MVHQTVPDVGRLNESVFESFKQHMLFLIMFGTWCLSLNLRGARSKWFEQRTRYAPPSRSCLCGSSNVEKNRTVVGTVDCYPTRISSAAPCWMVRLNCLKRADASQPSRCRGQLVHGQNLNLWVTTLAHEFLGSEVSVRAEDGIPSPRAVSVDRTDGQSQSLFQRAVDREVRLASY